MVQIYCVTELELQQQNHYHSEYQEL